MVTDNTSRGDTAANAAVFKTNEQYGRQWPIEMQRQIEASVATTLLTLNDNDDRWPRATRIGNPYRFVTELL